MEAAYERSLQFDRWRKRSLGEGEEKDPSTSSSSGFASYVWRAALLILGVSLFLPYSYNAGGPFVVHPKLQQPITTDVDGRIEAVFYDGGETVPKGTVVARLASTEEQAQAKVLEMKMLEQRAWIDHLKSLPRPEEVELARMQLEVEQTRVKFSRIQLDRIKSLSDQNSRRSRSWTTLASSSTSTSASSPRGRRRWTWRSSAAPSSRSQRRRPKWESLKAEREGYLDRVRRADLVMPFDGVLLTQYLNEKGNSYYKSGDVFADVESGAHDRRDRGAGVGGRVPRGGLDRGVQAHGVQLRGLHRHGRPHRSPTSRADVRNVIKVIAHSKTRLVAQERHDRVRQDPRRRLPVWEAFSRQVSRFVRGPRLVWNP